MDNGEENGNYMLRKPLYLSGLVHRKLLARTPAIQLGKQDKLLYRSYIGIMENKMETTIVYWGYMGIMEKKMETITPPPSCLDRVKAFFSYLWSAGNEGMEKKMETIMMG